MLDKFLQVAYRGELKKEASRQLVDKLKELPVEELLSYVNGDPNCKLAYAEACGQSAPSGEFCWLDKYKGTPLFEQAVQIEKALLQLDMEAQQQREAELTARPEPSTIWARRDALNLQKRMLDLDLVLAEAGGGAPPMEEAGPPGPPAVPAPPKAPKAPKEESVSPEELALLEQEASTADAPELALEQNAGPEGVEGAPQPPKAEAPQPPAPPKPKAPPQQAQGGEESEEEESTEGQSPKKDDKPKGMSVEVKQAGVWEGRSRAGVAPGSNVPVQQAGGNRQGAGASDDLPLQAAEKMASFAVDVGRFLAKAAADLTQSAREHIKPKNFAEPNADGPGDTGKYPIHDKAHARSALGLVGMHGSDAEKAKVRAAVAKKFPALSKEGSSPEGHHLRRFLLGNPVSSAIEAKPGSRLDAYGEAQGHQTAETLKGGLRGGMLGAGLGAAGGLGLALLNKGQPAKALGYGAGIGAYAGGLAGATYGGIKGTHGAEASRIHAARSKHNPPEEKVAFIGALKPLATQAGGVLGAGKSLAQSAYAKGGLGQVASSFGNVAKGFAQKNPLAAAGIAGAGGLVAGKALSN